MINATKERISGSVALRVAAGAPVPPDVADRLLAGGRALEVDCGGGLGCLALAEAFPAARVLGHDRDPAEIARAQKLARVSGLEDRVTFAVAGSTRLDRASFDRGGRSVSTRNDALQVLNAIRNALTPEGVCLLVEPTNGGGTPLVATTEAGRNARSQAIAGLAMQAAFRGASSPAASRRSTSTSSVVDNRRRLLLAHRRARGGVEGPRGKISDGRNRDRKKSVRSLSRTPFHRRCFRGTTVASLWSEACESGHSCSRPHAASSSGAAHLSDIRL